MAERAGRLNGRLLFGMVLFTLGVLFILDNFDVLEAESIIRWWPAILVLVGVAKLTGIGTSRHLVWGAMFTIFGTLLLGDHLGVWNFEFWNLWPVFLIVLGGSMLMRGFRSGTRGVAGSAGAAAGEDPTAELRSFAMMSGVTRRIVSQEFRGGELSAMMGGIELDLRQAKAKDGHAEIEVFVWWGGIDIQVPPSWRVSSEGLAIMGAIEDSSKPDADATQLLVLKGLVVMGGVEIKN